jgi:tripartite-type tricarboxylate transporter receptor subunit TctC
MNLGASRTRIAALCAFTALLVAGCGGGPAASGGSGPAGSTSPLRGKTITLIAPDAPGGDYDLYARIIAPGLGAALGATVNVENIAGAGTVVGTNQLAASAPNGLTIGLVDTGSDEDNVLEHKPGQTFSLTNFSWIGQVGNSPLAVVAQPSASYKTFTGVLTSATPVSILDETNSIGDMYNRVIFGAFGKKTKLLTGFADTSALKQGFLGHEGDLMTENEPAFLPLVTGGEATPILVTSRMPTTGKLTAAFGKASTIAQAEQSAGLSPSARANIAEAGTIAGLAFDLAAPPGTSASTLRVLRQALHTTLASASTKAQADKEGEPLDLIPGATLASDIRQMVANAPSIEQYLK